MQHTNIEFRTMANPNAASSPTSNHNAMCDLVDHTYHVYPATVDEDSSSPIVIRGPQLFPSKLRAMLSDPNSHEIIEWRPHGRAWAILDRDRLGELLLEHFGCDNVKKFLVSVKDWGFKVSLSPMLDACARTVIAR